MEPVTTRSPSPELRSRRTSSTGSPGSTVECCQPGSPRLRETTYFCRRASEAPAGSSVWSGPRRATERSSGGRREEREHSRVTRDGPCSTGGLHRLLPQSWFRDGASAPPQPPGQRGSRVDDLETDPLVVLALALGAGDAHAADLGRRQHVGAAVGL